jgi:invasion protein IalB
MKFARLAGVFAASGLMLAAGHAFAQAAAPATPPAAGQPAPPAQPGAPGAPGAPPGPVHVDLTPMQPQWTKVCGPDPNQGNKQTCLTSRDFSQGQQPTLSMAIYATEGVEKHTARFLLPIGMLLKPGFRIVLDKSEPIEGHFTICFPNFCVGEIEFGAPTLALMKKSQVLNAVMRNQGNLEVTLAAPIKDFGAAFDGPSIDPKVLQQQQEELQKQLEEQARKQRDLLEKQSQQGVAPPPAATAPVAAATPAAK